MTTVRHPLFRIAEAREQGVVELRRIADALEELVRLAKGEALPIVAQPTPPLPKSPFEGYVLSREGTVSNSQGSFRRPAGQIYLNRIGVGRNVPGHVFATVAKSPVLGTVSLAELDAFFRSNRMYTAEHFGKACRKLLVDWHTQLEELLLP